MATVPKTIRIPDETVTLIEETSRQTGRDFSSVANEMLTEAAKMRRIPGIAFGNSTTGRVARIAGTGLDVWEVVRTARALGESWPRLREEYHWLSETQLKAALAYARAYRDEIDKLIRLNEEWTREKVWDRYPFTAPSGAEWK